ncbi:MAG: alpha/beta hydrolase family protein [Dictyoglomus sp.]|nr:alpha/beta hydrolase family protein [Dictyoglomus sp.]MDW8188473.1 alpha/beta hydrolase family protein [Dictyoglomus sp.]
MVNYDPIKYFEELYTKERIYSFKAQSIEDWKIWREELRSKIKDLLGGFPEKIDLNSEILEKKEFNEYIREKIIFYSHKNIKVVGYLLIPKNLDFPKPAVIAVPGHGYGKDDIVGINIDGTERIIPTGYQKDFALTLVREGFITLAVEQLGFGERRLKEDMNKDKNKSSCRKLFFWGLMLGKPLLGIRVWDLIRAIDYLQERKEVKRDSIGIMGISGGGTTSLFVSALDDRIRATVISGYLNTFKDSILSISHCECNYIPGILNYAEMYDIASLIAPRYLFIEHGIYDNIFPISATKFSLEKIKKVYEFLGFSDNIQWEFFEGGHEIWGNKSIKWLKEKLS